MRSGNPLGPWGAEIRKKYTMKTMHTCIILYSYTILPTTVLQSSIFFVGVLLFFLPMLPHMDICMWCKLCGANCMYAYLFIEAVDTCMFPCIPIPKTTFKLEQVAFGSNGLRHASTGSFVGRLHHCNDSCNARITLTLVRAR